VYQISKEEGFEGKVIFLENYDINMARYLISGVDLWLNNPIRPNEASGTSGQKASLNGIPNASILDGWWPEAYNGKNGWAIGEERTYQSQDVQDEADSLALYKLLEDEIVPAFYNRDSNGLPSVWIKVMKEAIKTCAPVFSTFRMLKDYTNNMYIPSMKQAQILSQNGYSEARNLAAWKRSIYQNWSQVALVAQAPLETKAALGQEITITAQVHVGALKPADLSVEVVIANDEDGTLVNQTFTPMNMLMGPDSNGICHYSLKTKLAHGGTLVMGVRVLPTYPALSSKHELGLVRWA
jgi:starch phosphorylase